VLSQQLEQEFTGGNRENGGNPETAVETTDFTDGTDTDPRSMVISALICAICG
jgi:hypothetical protein